MKPALDSDPIGSFESTFRDQFAAVAENFLNSAIAGGQIDTDANAALSDELYMLMHEHKKLVTSLKWFRGITIFLIVAALIWAGVLYFWEIGFTKMVWPVIGFYAFCVLALVFICWKAIPKMRALSALIKNLDSEIAEKRQIALEQISALYRFFDWHTLGALVSQVIPELQFDNYLDVARLADIENEFNVRLPTDENCSIMAADSGTFFGYPFILARFFEFEWGARIWEGELEVSWTEYRRNSNGEMEEYTKEETLRAEITKPAPDFSVYSGLYFGHDAAPDLSFSRSPSEIAGKDGFWARVNKNKELKKLHKLEQNLNDGRGFTMMSNRDFEVLFHADDRDDEIGFRLLYTPLAQQNMVKLLNDTTVGFGDDFYYVKRGKFTCVASEHLQNSLIAPTPFYTEYFDLREVKKYFMDISCKFFKDIYFAFAPLMSVPMYNEKRQKSNQFAHYKGISAYELETAVNAIGDEPFRHPSSITDNVLKINNIRFGENSAAAEVCSMGFRGEDRVDYVPCTASNGKTYRVPVPWIEYIPVYRQTTIEAVLDEAPGAENIDGYRRRNMIFTVDG